MRKTHSIGLTLLLLACPLAHSTTPPPPEDLTTKVLEKDTRKTGKNDYRETSTFRRGILVYKFSEKDVDLDGVYEIWNEELCVEGKTVIKIIKFPSGPAFRSVKWDGVLEIMESEPTPTGMYASVTLIPKDTAATEEFAMQPSGHYQPVPEAARSKSVEQIVFGRKVAAQMKASQNREQ